MSVVAVRADRDASWPLARLGGTLGAAAAAGLGLLRALLAEPPVTGADIFGYLAFAISYLAPFVVALLAIRIADPRIRRGVWMGAGILGLLLSLTSFAGVTLILIPGSVLLLLGARRLRSDVSARWSPTPGLVAGTIVLVGAASWFALILHPDPRCFILSRSGGTEVWRQVPVGSGQPSLSLGPGEMEGVCTSDVTTSPEAALSAGIWLGAAGTVAAVVAWRSHAPNGATS